MKALAKGLQGLLGPRARAFRGLLENPGEAQARLLEELCARIRRTAYGRRHGVEGSGSFQRMPVVDYEALEPWILRERQGERCLLDRAPLGFEPTSGSRGPVKWIPVTRGLRSSFTSMFMLWAHDLLARGPGLGDGRLFASSTPGVADRPGAFQRDDDYLSPWLRPLLRPFLLWNPAGEGPPRTYLDRLAQGLLAAEDLEAMSVWSPSYLLVLMDHAQGAAGAVLEGLEGRVGSGRLGDLRRALAEGSWERVWPRLRLVSCWDGGQAKPLARRLAARLPHAWLQGKGLLATEAPLTFPSLAAGGFLPLLDQVYLELEDEAGLRPLAEAQVGRAYGVVITQKGGLARYRLGDQVRVTHRHRGTPCLEFTGRLGGVSDRVGEKLTEAFLLQVRRDLGVAEEAFFRLVPREGPPPHYLLLCQEPVPAPRLEAALQESHRYQEARRLGQLGAARVFHHPDLPRRWARTLLEGGAHWGQEKPTVLALAPLDDPALARLAGEGPPVGECP